MVTAGFRFDCPVRFDTDRLEIDLAAFEAGAIYGLGARLALPVGEALALSIRAEAVALRRGVADDLALAGALGLLF